MRKKNQLRCFYSPKYLQTETTEMLQMPFTANEIQKRPFLSSVTQSKFLSVYLNYSYFCFLPPDAGSKRSEMQRKIGPKQSFSRFWSCQFYKKNSRKKYNYLKVVSTAKNYWRKIACISFGSV